MNTVPAEILSEYVKSQSFTSTEEIMNAIVYIVLQVLLCLFAVYLLGPLTRPYMSL